jgi:hypothetical protein
MARPRLGLVGAVERVGVALLPAAITATVATSITLRMRPADDVRVILLITVAPYAIPALLILIKYRPEKPSLTLPSTVTLACLGNLILAIVMRTYWSSPVDNEDFGWPVTDIALLSLAYAILFLVAIPVWVIARPASSGGWRR